MNPDLKKLTDGELLTRYTEGEEAAFREIVSRYNQLCTWHNTHPHIEKTLQFSKPDNRNPQITSHSTLRLIQGRLFFAPGYG